MHQRIANGIKQARGTRSAQWLADRTAELGQPVSRSQIANYENGRKKGLDVAELTIIAAALGVPPVALMYPNLPDGEVERIPGEVVTATAATRWFSGDRTVFVDDNDMTKLLQASRMRDDAVYRARRQRERIVKMQERGEDAGPQIDYGNEIRLLERLIRGLSGAVLVDESEVSDA